MEPMSFLFFINELIKIKTKRIQPNMPTNNNNDKNEEWGSRKDLVF